MRGLPAVLQVNTNTVLRALRILRDEGLLEFAAGTASVLPGRPSAVL
jgi:GntR family transcriptional regulator